MKVAVTLASGKLGHAIINELSKNKKDYEIVAYSRDTAKAQFHGIETRKGDYDAPEDWNNSLGDIDILIIISSIVDPAQRVIQHRTIINAAKNQHVKKIIYTSIIGSDKDTGFGPIVKSNRETENDIINSGLPYIIGRNGLYIDPDVEFIDEYKKAGNVWNCAGEGKCCYTSREELGIAYTKLAFDNDKNSNIFNLCGMPYSQQDLVDAFNQICHLHLIYKYVSVEDFKENRSKALGDFFGTLIAGIYESIAKGYFNVPSDFFKATGIEPQTLKELIESELKKMAK